MTFELGRAEFIIETNNVQALRDETEYFAETRRQASDAAQFLAKLTKSRVSDVKAAAAILIAEEKKIANEALKEQKRLADEQKKNTQELVKFNKAQYEADLRNWKNILKERDTTLKKDAAEQAKIAKQASEAALRQERYTLSQAANLRRQAAEEERRRQRDEERKARQAAQPTKFDKFVSGLPGDLATIAGFGAIASGAILIREALVRTIEATTKQEEAQRALNAAFKDTNAIYKENANLLAGQFNRVESEIQKASAALGVLDKQSTLSTKQIKALQAGAIEVQAAFGGDLQEAFRSAAAAVLGETEAFEKYGLVLQEGVLKNSEKLTESERKRFTTMSESEKQMIRYRLIMEHVAGIQGAAAQRANDTQGGFDKLNRAVDELAKAIGGPLVKELGAVSGAFGTALESGLKFLQLHAKIRELQREAPDANWYERYVEGNLGMLAPRLPDYLRSSTPEQRLARQREIEEQRKAVQDAIDAQVEARRDAEAEERKRQDEEDNANKIRLEKAEAALKYAHDQEIKRIEDERKIRERELANRLRAIDDERDAELERLETIEEARRREFELETIRINAEKDAAIDAAEERKRTELERIDTEKEDAHAAAEEAIKNLEIERDTKLRANEQQRDDTLQRLEDEKEARDKIRKDEDRSIEDSIKNQERQLEDQHQRTLRRLERETEALREKYDKENDKIDELIQKEDDRHSKRLRQIDDEADEQIKKIDEEIDRINDAEEKLSNARRRRNLNNNLTDAQRRLREATGTQDPVAREAAQAKLIAAIRLGDPVAIKKAQDELAEIVGQGTRAIEEAQRDLADAQDDLREHDVKETNDAQKDKLEAEKKRIREEQEQEKRQEEDRNKRRKRRLEDDKDANKKALDDALKGIEKLKEREDDSYRNRKRQQDDFVEYNKRKLEDKRRDEDAAYETTIETERKRYKDEQDNIEETYNGPKGYIANIRAATKQSDEDYENQRKAAEARYRSERDYIRDTYDGPDGILTRRRLDEQDRKIAYDNAVEAARQKADKLKVEVGKEYRADDGESGILDRLDKQKDYTDKKLEEILKSFEQHKKGLVEPGGVITTTWEEAKKLAEEYFNYVRQETERRNRPRPPVVYGPPDPANPHIPPGPGPDPNDGGGMGTTPDQPGTTASTGTPDPEVSSVSIDPDEVDDAFSTSFGYAEPYSGSYTPGPGWEGGAAWPGGPSHHKGVDLTLPGPRNGYGKPVPAFHAGRIIRTAADSRGPGGNMVIIEDDEGRTHWYLHLKDYVRTSGRVNRGDIIAHLGDTGTEEFPHLHYEVRNGDNNGPMSLDALRRHGIDPMPFVRGQRDSGYLYTNPTLTYDLRTGEKGILAEKRPERLLGGKETQQLESMGISRIIAQPARLRQNNFGIGAALANDNMMMTSVTNNRGGDTMVYHGVAPENLIKQWRKDQRKNRVLYGRVKI